MSGLMVLSVLSAGVWAVLLLAHGRFWWADQWLRACVRPRLAWPEVVAVIPARDEADVIGDSIESLMASRYPGRFSVILVDDGSSDGTADVARGVAAAAASPHRLEVLSAPPLAPGWTGKTAAQRAGLAASLALAPDARYVLFTDADIVHGPDVLARLVEKAQDEGRALVSLMAKLDSRGLWGRLLIPAFVFFFQKLYPFPRVNDQASMTAGAAGGCMLVRRTAFLEAGGFEAMRDALIDDCALARLLKVSARRRSIWLGLTHEVVSRRDNRSLASVWTMVARTAFAQLGHSAWLLAGTVLGMGLVYLVPPVVSVTTPWHGQTGAGVVAALTWAAMVVAYAPMAWVYGQGAWRGLMLPVAAFLYMLMTLTSALKHWQGRGGQWKGRSYSHLTGSHSERGGGEVG